MGSCEVGTVPGTYRLMDLYCLREVLNQIMKCSCQSDMGFAMFQTEEDNTPPTFHSVLDIICRNCQQKVSFGTSVLTGKHEKQEMQSDVDARLVRFFQLCESGATGGFQALWRELYNSDGENTAVPRTISPLLLDESTSPEIEETPAASSDAAVPPSRMVDFVSNCADQEQEIVICYSCHNIFTTLEFAVHQAAGTCGLKKAVVGHPTARAGGGQADYPCPDCGKVFTKLFNLQQHARIHTGERPLACAHCDKRFADRSSRNKHQRTVHEQRRPHSCAVCFKGFPSTSHLNEHMATHSKERKFACQVCSRTFSFRSSLKKHLGTHTEEKPFRCKVCLKDFKTKTNIKAHMVKVHRLPLTRFNSEAPNK